MIAKLPKAVQARLQIRFFEMSKHYAIKALSIYKRAGQQAEHPAHFYDLCRGLDVARTFQFPTLKQPPASFLETMEEYIREAPQMGSMPNNRLEYQETKQKPEQPEEPFPKLSENKVEEAKNSIEKQAEEQEEALPKKEETPPLISREEPADLLGLNQLDPKVAELEERNALALAIIPPGKENPSANNQAIDTGKTSGWELALLTAPSNNRSKIVSDKELLKRTSTNSTRYLPPPTSNRPGDSTSYFLTACMKMMQPGGKYSCNSQAIVQGMGMKCLDRVQSITMTLCNVKPHCPSNKHTHDDGSAAAATNDATAADEATTTRDVAAATATTKYVDGTSAISRPIFSTNVVHRIFQPIRRSLRLSTKCHATTAKPSIDLELGLADIDEPAETKVQQRRSNDFQMLTEIEMHFEPNTALNGKILRLTNRAAF
ncbi:hypothetical protein CQW23_07213 [Capsicum baccatum]|uniref:AP180 N-terminal homology (ANTH) domain-containing protein n=1 Tax=Capsicum baccatum TaxID=33114 RepID=A0A2G2X5K1_CAPBA|nr:hypothetical protein CQW23_07213 [Capsicum baccatum]